MIEGHLLKKTTVINKIVPDFMDTLYMHTVVTVPNDSGLNRAERTKITEYQDLKNDIRETWNAREADIIPVVVGATGIVKSNLVTYLSSIPGNPAFQEVQESAVRGTVSILKRALGHHSR